ncbi:hypothetical protein M5D96_013934 [Drosophila gunungcola]|uniref:Single domain-containing protein n=1 Tax=Drosophila gunungcola TaxID=103775 RepID=A0A9P9YAZ1_9MUSC|nr:hypothetical protein M5D96_013934 [Drosophila gunungcola]
MSGALFMAFVACLMVSSVAANGFSTQYQGHTQHPTIPEHCLYKELDLAVPLHGFLLPAGHNGYCIRLECTDDYLLLIRQCPSIASLKPCKLTSDLSKPYPGCCPKYDC